MLKPDISKHRTIGLFAFDLQIKLLGHSRKTWRPTTALKPIKSGSIMITPYENFYSINATSETIAPIWLLSMNDSAASFIPTTENGMDVILSSPTPSTSSLSWFTTIRIQIILYVAILLLAIIGNALVILTLIHNRRMRTITNVFLLNLAISDILLGVLCMPITLIGTLLRDFVFGEVMCKLLPYLQGKQLSRVNIYVFHMFCRYIVVGT